MATHFRPIRKETVMCTVQGCAQVAEFAFTGEFDGRSGGRSVVAAYCHAHAQETAVRLGHPWPIPGHRQPEPMVRALAFRAGW